MAAAQREAIDPRDLRRGRIDSRLMDATTLAATRHSASLLKLQVGVSDDEPFAAVDLLAGVMNPGGTPDGVGALTD